MTAHPSLAQIGAALPATPTTAGPRSSHARFRDITAYTHGGMPTVVPGQVWADCDPRQEGRTVRVVALRADSKAVIETVTVRTVDSRYAPAVAREAVGAFHAVALRRFRPGSRGYRLIVEAPAAKAGATSPAAAVETAPGTDSVALLAELLANGAEVIEQDRRAAAALLALLGENAALEFLSAVPSGRFGGGDPAAGHAATYLEFGLPYVLYEAGMWFDKQ